MMDAQRLAAAAVRECFEISKIYRQNAGIKHGLPHPPTDQQNSWDATQDQLAKERNTAEKTRLEYLRLNGDSPSPAPTPPPQSSPANPPSAVKQWLLPAIVAAAGVAGGWGAHTVINGGGKEAPPPPIETNTPDGSLLQWLEEGGFHLPPGNGDGL